MGITLRGPIGDFEIKARHELPPGDKATPFYDMASALSFLRGFMHDPFAMAALRALAIRSLKTSSLTVCSDHMVIQQLAVQLAAGWLCLIPRAHSRPYALAGGAGRPPVVDGTEEDESPAQQPQMQEPATPALDPSPPVAQATTHWITFHLVDDDTEAPVAGVDLRLKLPDGTTSTYTTDADGLVHLVDLPAGTCDLEQMFDMEAFEVVRFE